MADRSWSRWPFLVGSVYNYLGRSDLWIEYGRAALRRSPEPDVYVRGSLVMALAFAGRLDEAAAGVAGLLDSAAATRSSYIVGSVLLSIGQALFDSDPPMALDAARRVTAENTRIGYVPGHSNSLLARAEAAHGEPLNAFEAGHNAWLAYAAAGDRAAATTPLSVLATLLHRFGHDDTAAVVVGCCESAMLDMYPEVAASIQDLRDTLGEDTFEALASRGRAMESAEVFRYAQEQITAAIEVLPNDGEVTRTA
jgi:hypothetical protein